MSPFEHIRLLQSLSIENCLLDRLSTDTFRGLTFLRNLTIKQTVPIRKDSKENLTQNDRIDGESLVIERLAFRHIESAIENLDLSQNNIKSLPNDLFCPFLNLQTLNLSNNALANLTSFGLIDPATGRLCLQELYDLDLSNNRLESVPETSGVAALKNLQNLNLSYNKIIEITELTFSALRKLSILDLSNNNLRSLPNRTFRDSDELKELNLAKNNLIRIPSGLFQGLSKLQVLNMADNQIVSGSIGGETFADLIRVIVMNFSGNKLRQLSASAFQNQYSLQVLLLENNDLETIEEGTFATLYNLHTLKLSGNRFQHLPESIFTGLFVLNELHLSGNLLEHIHDDAFKNCTHLKTLELSSNLLTSIPLAIRSLNKLEKLNLSANKFTTLTDATPLTGLSIRKLDISDNYLINVTRNALRPIGQTLEELRLDGNRLRALNKEIFSDLQQKLKILRIDRNELTDVINVLSNVKHLEKLEIFNISRNSIMRFDYSLLPKSLRILDISYNRIQALGNHFEHDSRLRLEELDASENQLKEISANSIPNSIRILNLRHNQIEKLNQFTFVAKHNVTFVDLRDNSLKKIDNNAFRLGVQRPTTDYFISSDALTNPQAYVAASNSDDEKSLPPPIFLISGNPYYCDCTMEWLQRVNQLVGGVTGSGMISTYPRIGDLDLVECELPFARQVSSINHKHQTDLGVVKSNRTSVFKTDESHIKRIPLLTANSSDFLCRYRSHCFALCHCCEFDACDCEMMCPENCTCYYDQTWNTNIVDCSGGHYHKVPARIPMDVTALYLDGNNLQSLNAHTFIGRKNLRILHLNHSMVEEIANRSFNGLVYLEELHLDHNRLTSLYGYEFESLQYLTTLNLNHNQLSFIGEKIFQSLRSLQRLRLDHNHLATFGQWFSLDLSSNFPHPYSNNRMLLSLSNNPWSCKCTSMASFYENLWQLQQYVTLIDDQEIKCTNGTNLFVLQTATRLIDQCNLTRQYITMISQHSRQFPPIIPSIQMHNSPITVAPPSMFSTESQQNIQYPQSAINFDSIYHQIQQNTNQPSQTPNFSNGDEENDPDLTYQPIDMLGGLKPLFPLNSSKNQSQKRPMSYFPSSPSSSASSSSSISFSNWIYIIIALSSIIILITAMFLIIRNKQDIQLWFYGRYGIRLFESGFCLGHSYSGPHSGSRSVSGSRNRRRNCRKGLNDSYVRDSEKLFDAFVIYAKQDESFVTQQLAAELECGYPPYRLCLRYRDLPAPSNTDTLSNESGTISLKDHGYAFDAVTQAIECSRRTLVVISEQFLQSEWCKFELKAAHQETLVSCKAHRLIVVVVPPGIGSTITPGTNNLTGYNQSKLAEMLLQRLDNETKTCVRGVSILTWQERRFWEKLRFSMPASSTIGTSINGSSSGVIGHSASGVVGFNSGLIDCSNRSQLAGNPVVCDNSTKGRASTVIVTNSGYPTLGPSSLSSSSSLARSSVLYDFANNQPIYSGQNSQTSSHQHYYHQAQLPPSQNNPTW
ncbi:toll-like protein [Sarcoptes scabiei]|uniref:Toll-like protein n=1 Tax=Sarcoptes scabiei TaxID=52283 RepID=A0A132AN04_SARSC|nr:toll-like protein [Sarcoptes scabiei]